MPVIGFSTPLRRKALRGTLVAFLKAWAKPVMSRASNVAIEYRWAEGQNDRLPAMAADLVHRQVAVIAATTTPAALAAKAATTTIPIVFEIGRRPGPARPCRQPQPAGRQRHGRDPIERGGSAEAAGVAARAAPHGDRHGAARQPDRSRSCRAAIEEVQAAARTLGLELHVLDASTERDFDAVFAKLIQLRAGGLVIGGDRILHQPERTARRAGGPPRGARDLSRTASSPRPAA